MRKAQPLGEKPIRMLRKRTGFDFQVWLMQVVFAIKGGKGPKSPPRGGCRMESDGVRGLSHWATAGKAPGSRSRLLSSTYALRMQALPQRV